MRYQAILGATMLASAAIVATAPTAMSQTTTEKVEQKVQKAKGGMSDSWVTAKTKIALYADERVKGRQITVKTHQGNVALRGKVDSMEAKAAASSVSEGIEGVKRVKNDLQIVAPGERKAVDTTDAAITRQVKDRMEKNTQMANVDVRTDNAVVSLTGKVPGIGVSARASELAREVPSVRAVKNELTHEGDK